MKRKTTKTELVRWLIRKPEEIEKKINILEKKKYEDDYYTLDAYQKALEWVLHWEEDL